MVYCREFSKIRVFRISFVAGRVLGLCGPRGSCRSFEKR